MDQCEVFRANYEECRAEAAKATVPSSKAQWLLFAEEWLKQAEAAEDQQRREAAILVGAPAKEGRRRPKPELRRSSGDVRSDQVFALAVQTATGDG